MWHGHYGVLNDDGLASDLSLGQYDLKARAIIIPSNTRVEIYYLKVNYQPHRPIVALYSIRRVFARPVGNVDPSRDT